jgi:hypothetical protein
VRLPSWSMRFAAALIPLEAFVPMRRGGAEKGVYEGCVLGVVVAVALAVRLASPLPR